MTRREFFALAAESAGLLTSTYTAGGAVHLFESYGGEIPSEYVLAGPFCVESGESVPECIKVVDTEVPAGYTFEVTRVGFYPAPECKLIDLENWLGRRVKTDEGDRTIGGYALQVRISGRSLWCGPAVYLSGMGCGIYPPLVVPEVKPLLKTVLCHAGESIEVEVAGHPYPVVERFALAVAVFGWVRHK